MLYVAFAEANDPMAVFTITVALCVLQSAYVCGLCLCARSGSLTWFAGGECEPTLGGAGQCGGL